MIQWQDNTTVNNMPISYETNRLVGSVAPSCDLHKLQTHKQVLLDDADMYVILESHLILAHPTQR